MKLVIVDDHPLVRVGLMSLFSTEEDIELIGEAASVSEAVPLISASHPDIALIDLNLGSESGLSVIRECKSHGVLCRYMVLSSSANHSDFQLAMDEGIDGYALKEALPEELLYALRLVAKGRRYFDPMFLEDPPSLHRGYHEHLTSKEMEVLRALGRGLNNREIARQLFITEFTVKKHVSQILAKLNLADRTQAALWANANGLATYSVGFSAPQHP